MCSCARKVPQWTGGRDEGHLHRDLTGDDGLLQVLLIFPSILAGYPVPSIMFRFHVRNATYTIARLAMHQSCCLLLLLLCVACTFGASASAAAKRIRL